MTVEEDLKALILASYKSIREFSIALKMPYSTLDSIFKRGVENASIGNIIKICSALNLSVDELAAGKLAARQTPITSPDETELLGLYRAVIPVGQEHIMSTARMVAGNPDMRKAGRPAPYVYGTCAYADTDDDSDTEILARAAHRATRTVDELNESDL